MLALSMRPPRRCLHTHTYIRVNIGAYVQIHTYTFIQNTYIHTWKTHTKNTCIHTHSQSCICMHTRRERGQHRLKRNTSLQEQKWQIHTTNPTQPAQEDTPEPTARRRRGIHTHTISEHHEELRKPTAERILRRSVRLFEISRCISEDARHSGASPKSTIERFLVPSVDSCVGGGGIIPAGPS